MLWLLWLVIVVLFAIWIAGLVSHFLGGVIWVFFAAAVVLALLSWLFRGRVAT